MRFKSFALGGAAIVGLAVAALPAAAYTHHPSTPEEQRQTEDLNARSLANAQVQPASQSTSAMTAMPDQTAQNGAMSTQPGAATSDQQAMNSAPTAPVESAPANSPTGSGNAMSNSSAQVATEGASSGMATAAASGAVSLAQVANPPQTLANASVETMNGQAVGAVQKVVTDDSGKAQTLDIALLGPQSKIVAINAAQLSYDQSRNVVVAQLSADQIQAMPPAPQG